MTKHRNTKRQQDILDALSRTDDYIYSEVGTQPHTARAVAYLLWWLEYEGKEPSVASVRATLKRLAAKGLVSVEKVKEPVHNGLGEVIRPLDGYWNVETMPKTQAAAKAWNDGAEQRAAKALDAMVAGFSARKPQ